MRLVGFAGALAAAGLTIGLAGIAHAEPNDFTGRSELTHADSQQIVAAKSGEDQTRSDTRHTVIAISCGGLNCQNDGPGGDSGG